MEKVRPIYKKLLILALVLYVIGVTYALSDIYRKIGGMEHALCHMSANHAHSK